MLRAVVLAARLQFTIDEPILDAIEVHRHEIARSAPARLVEEYYKILRSGHAEEAMRAAARDRAAEGDHAGARRGARRAVAVDRARSIAIASGSPSAPESLTNAILAGTLLQPLGLIRRQRFSADPLERRVELGMLPIARRDVERLQQILAIQPRLLDIEAPARAQRGLLHRAILDEALTWLEIHGDRPEVVAHWRELKAQAASQPVHAAEAATRTRLRHAVPAPPPAPTTPRQLRRAVLRTTCSDPN